MSWALNQIVYPSSIFADKDFFLFMVTLQSFCCNVFISRHFLQSRTLLIPVFRAVPCCSAPAHRHCREQYPVSYSYSGTLCSSGQCHSRNAFRDYFLVKCHRALRNVGFCCCWCYVLWCPNG